jgi:hypothetical protein
MDCLPFDVQPVIERLAANVPALRKVAGAADYATLTRLQDFTPPCAYVLLAREAAETIHTGDATPGSQISVRQAVPASFGVVVAVRNYREQMGAQSAETLLPILGAIRKQLIGWIPADCSEPILLKSGSLRDYDRATTVWIDVYTTSHFIGVNP